MFRVQVLLKLDTVRGIMWLSAYQCHTHGTDMQQKSLDSWGRAQSCARHTGITKGATITLPATPALSAGTVCSVEHAEAAAGLRRCCTRSLAS